MSNAALLLALCIAAAAVAVARRRFALAAWIAGCGAAAALSLLPYAAQLADARRQWSAVIVDRVGVHRIALAFAATVGPRPALLTWLLLIVAGLAGVTRALARRRAAGSDPEAAGSLLTGDRRLAGEDPRRRDVMAFAGLTIVGATLATLFFLRGLGYPPRPWYFLPLMALLAGALDTIFGDLARSGRRFAIVRFAAVGLVAAAQAVPLWQHLTIRQTNADLVAKAVTKAAAPQDLVVVVPWYYGVSFNRYYKGAARWLTLPVIPDHRIHRYDLLKARLAAQRPLEDLLQAVAATLRSGHRVWLAGNAAWPAPGEVVTVLPPAPRSPAGWHDYPYLVDWSLQLGQFLENHAATVATVAVPAGGPVSDLEDLDLAMVQGWRDRPGRAASATPRPRAL